MALGYAGRFSDGRSAVRRDVEVRFDGDALVIAGNDGAILARWTYGDLRLAGEVFRGQPIRLTAGAGAEARLSVADRGFLRPLYAQAPQLRPSHISVPGSWRHVVAWGLAIGVFVAVLFLALPRLAEPVAALIPLEWEEALGAQTIDGLVAGARVCDGDAGRRALQRLTDRLAATVETRYRFRVHVADVSENNAFAAPGGHIVLFRGLLDFAESGDEVAGVLAHEMGHVIERHATEAVVRAAGVSLVFEVLVGDLSGLLSLAAGAGQMLLALSYSRHDEAEADAIGLDILARAGIRADGLAAFFDRLATKDDGVPETLSILSSHPPSRDRAARVKALEGRGLAALSAADWRALKSICN